jgi:hypothetical protein
MLKISTAILMVVMVMLVIQDKKRMNGYGKKIRRAPTAGRAPQKQGTTA